MQMPLETSTLINALRACEERLTLVINREQGKLLDCIARDNARSTIASIEAQYEAAAQQDNNRPFELSQPRKPRDGEQDI